MTPFIKNIVKDLLSQTNNEFLFWNTKKNSYFTSNDVNNYLRKLNKNYHIVSGTLHSHILRHTFITRSVESGMNLKVIQYLVGHTRSSSITLDTYTSVSTDFIKKEIRKLKNFEQI